MGGVLAWASARTARTRPGVAARLEQRPKTTGVMDGSTPDAFALIRPMDLRVIGAQHQLHHQCLHCLRGQEDPGVHIMADIPAGNQEAI